MAEHIWRSRGRRMALLAALLAVLGLAASGPATAAPAPVAAAADCTPVVHQTSGLWGHLDRITSVAAAGPGNVWAIGQAQTPQHTTTSTLLHWMGTEWQTVALPEQDLVLGKLTAFGPEDVWATAHLSFAGIPDLFLPFVLHWDGTIWRAMQLPSDGLGKARVAAIGGSGPTDLWAVGSQIWHSDGRQWQQQDELPVRLGGLALRGITAPGPRDAWAIGAVGTSEAAPDGTPVVFHWDGSSWVMVSGAINGITPKAIASAPGQTGVWLVGSHGSAHWDGHGWTTVPVPGIKAEAGGAFLTDVAVTADGAAWAIGEGYPNPATKNSPSPAIYRWDGARWTLVPGSLGTPMLLYYSLTVEGPGDVWAGGAEASSAPGGGSVARMVHIFSPCGLPTARVADPHAGGVRYFPEVGHTLGGPFRAYWEAHGGLAQFGYPITEEYPEPNATDGQTYRVQYFQRSRFEYHPEYAGSPHEVLLGLLGRSTTDGTGAGFAPLPSAPPGARFFPQTGHTLAPDLVAYWESHDGLAVDGYPISEPVTITPFGTKMQPYIVQYFERNRLEYHPDFPPDFRVSLGLLGTEVLQARGWLP